MISIEGINISKSFGTHRVLDSLSFRIKASEKFLVSGRNGSGKSTLLRIMAELSAPSSGEMIYKKGAISLKRDDLFTKMSYISPETHLYSDLSAEENLGILLSKESSCGRALAILGDFGLNDFAGRRIKHLSTGMIQKVKLSYAFGKESELLVLDEPESNLDSDGKNVLHNLIKKSKATIVIASNLSDYKYFKRGIVIDA